MIHVTHNGTYGSLIHAFICLHTLACVCRPLWGLPPGVLAEMIFLQDESPEAMPHLPSSLTHTRSLVFSEEEEAACKTSLMMVAYFPDYFVLNPAMRRPLSFLCQA